MTEATRRPDATSQETPGGFRWLLVAAALLLQFSIGAVYAWSTFSGALEKASAFELTKVQAAIPFEVTIGMIFIGSFLGGRLQDARGPRPVALIGGVVYAVGVILA
jgi:OFA family oxalate/formate antiporter-like MFS transporter